MAVLNCEIKPLICVISINHFTASNINCLVTNVFLLERLPTLINGKKNLTPALNVLTVGRV